MYCWCTSSLTPSERFTPPCFLLRCVPSFAGEWPSISTSAFADIVINLMSDNYIRNVQQHEMFVRICCAKAVLIYKTSFLGLRDAIIYAGPEKSTRNHKPRLPCH